MVETTNNLNIFGNNIPKFQYGFETVNGIVKKVYNLSEIPNIKEKCDVWDILPLVYVRQFTNEKDCEGKDIYDGDIAHYDDKPYNVNGLKVTGQIVRYKGTSWALKYKSSYATHGFGYYVFSCEDFFNRKVTVIGNIYENPELLQ